MSFYAQSSQKRLGGYFAHIPVVPRHRGWHHTSVVLAMRLRFYRDGVKVLRANRALGGFCLDAIAVEGSPRPIFQSSAPAFNRVFRNVKSALDFFVKINAVPIRSIVVYFPSNIHAVRYNLTFFQSRL